MKSPTRRFFVLCSTLLFLFSILCFSSPLSASSDEDNDGAMGYFMFGGNAFDLEPLNSRLAEKGYSAFSDELYSLGGGGHIVIGDFIIGGQGHGLFARETSSGDFKLSLNAGYGTFDIGYILFSPGHFKVYPMIGVGYGGMQLKIVERRPSSPFDDVLEDPRRNVELRTGSLILDFSLGTAYTIDFSDDEDSEGGFILGVQAGYTLYPFKGTWKMDELDVTDGPELGITGPYVHVMLGFGGFSVD